MNRNALTKGQKGVLVATSIPMAAVGIAGAVASFFNFQTILASKSAALSIVAAGEGATMVAALVLLSLTLLGQHTPAAVRAALWILPAVASVAGFLLADTTDMKVVMTAAPLAMTVAGEGTALVARRIVRYATGFDVDADRKAQRAQRRQQKRSGLLLWHVQRADSGTGWAQKMSTAAVWRLTRQFAATDTQMSVQLAEVQRFRITEGADAKMARVLSGGQQQPQTAAVAPVAPAPALPAADDANGPQDDVDDPDGYAWIKGILDEAPVDDTDPTAGLWTADQVAQYRNVKPGTVRSWVHRQKLPVAYRDTDGRAFFAPADVAKLP